MKLIEIKKLEDCFDGSVIFQYSFDKEVEEELMKKLGQVGKLYYYPDFMRPFFKITTSDGLQIKGIIGEKNFEITYPQTKKWEKKKKFESNLERFLREII